VGALGVGELDWVGTGVGCGVGEAGEVGVAGEVASAVGVGTGVGSATVVGSTIGVGPEVGRGSEVGGEPGTATGVAGDGSTEQPATASRKIVMNPNKYLTLIFLPSTSTLLLLSTSTLALTLIIYTPNQVQRFRRSFFLLKPPFSGRRRPRSTRSFVRRDR
jgi:hypothetical protein